MNYIENTPLLELKNNNYSVTAVKLNTLTDETDTLVEKSVKHLFAGNMSPLCGNIFIISDCESGNSTIILTYAADFEVPSLYIKAFTVFLSGGNFGLEVFEAPTQRAESEIRKRLLRFCPKKTVMMSNTWGDCNGWSRVNAEFVKKEIDAARELMIDAVQIDDGWQKGSTGDRSIIDENGRRRFDGDFWEINSERFPGGLGEMRDYARRNGVKLGLWFAPDFHGNFAHFDRDTGILEEARQSYGCKFFKLDMLHILNSADKRRFEEMAERLSASGLLELDVTNGKRLGYLLSLTHGIIFTENRYTKSGNYYPYRTLKNMWELGHFLPLQALQAEVANPQLNKERYNSPLAPENYDLDYIFASVCFANPLFWMEMQFLSEESRKQLRRIMPAYRAVRENISACEIIPIGDMPDGRGFTGFFALGEGSSYAVLLSGIGEARSYTYTLPGEFTSCHALSANGEASLSVTRRLLTVEFAKPNSYAFVELLHR